MSNLSADKVLRVNCPGWGVSSTLPLGEAKPLAMYDVLVINPTSIIHLFEPKSDNAKQIDKLLADGSTLLKLDSDSTLESISAELELREHELRQFLAKGGLLVFFLAPPFMVSGVNVRMDNYGWLYENIPDKADGNARTMTPTKGKEISVLARGKQHPFAPFLNQLGMEFNTIVRKENLTDGFKALANGGSSKVVAGFKPSGPRKGQVIFLPAPYETRFDDVLKECIQKWHELHTGPEADKPEAEASEEDEPDIEGRALLDNLLADDSEANKKNVPYEQPAASSATSDFDALDALFAPAAKSENGKSSESDTVRLYEDDDPLKIFDEPKNSKSNTNNLFDDPIPSASEKKKSTLDWPELEDDVPPFAKEREKEREKEKEKERARQDERNRDKSHDDDKPPGGDFAAMLASELNEEVKLFIAPDEEAEENEAPRDREREERARDEEKDRERQREDDKDRDKARDEDKDRERARDDDKDRDKTRDEDKDRERARDDGKDRDKARDEDKDRERARDDGKDRDKARDEDKDRERARDDDKDRERARDDDKDRDRAREAEKDRDKSREGDKDRDGTREEEKDRDKSRDEDKDRERARDEDRNRDKPSDEERDRERSRDDDKDRDKTQEDKDRERERARDEEREKERERTREEEKDRERERTREEEKDRERERAREEEREKDRERERAREEEERERERAREEEREKEKAREEEEREREREREKVREEERERERAKAREEEEERERERAKEEERERERARLSEEERAHEREREEREREKARAENREAEAAREMQQELDRAREADKERQKAREEEREREAARDNERTSTFPEAKDLMSRMEQEISSPGVPDWCQKVSFAELKQLHFELTDLNEQVRKARQKIGDIEDRIRTLGELKDALLSLSGIRLTQACCKVFEALGWSVKISETSSGEVWLSEGDKTQAIVRIVFSLTQPNRSELAELAESVITYWGKYDIEPKGILVASTFAEKPPKDRTEEDFPGSMGEFAKRKNLCLFTSQQLLTIYRDVAIKNADIRKIRENLLTTSGILTGFKLDMSEGVAAEAAAK